MSTRLGPKMAQRIEFPNGDVAILCGPPPRVDALDCGHEVITFGGRPAKRRRCADCLAESKLV
jgi:hypothetical protein